MTSPSSPARRFAEARAKLPDLSVDQARFVEAAQAAGANGVLHAEELYLALACSQGDRAAVALLERDYIVRVPEYVRHLSSRGLDLGELAAAVRERLLPPPLGADNRISAFDGRTALSSWLRVVVVRVALDLLRKMSAGKRRAAHDWMELPGDLQGVADPLGDVLRLKYQPVLDRGLHLAMSELSVRERLLLRMHFVEGASLDVIGRMYGKNRTTVFRWLEKVRHKIRSASLAHVKGELAVTTGEVESLVRLLESRLDLDLATLLASE